MEPDTTHAMPARPIGWVQHHNASAGRNSLHANTITAMHLMRPCARQHTGWCPADALEQTLSTLPGTLFSDLVHICMLHRSRVCFLDGSGCPESDGASMVPMACITAGASRRPQGQPEGHARHLLPVQHLPPGWQGLQQVLPPWPLATLSCEQAWSAATSPAASKQSGGVMLAASCRLRLGLYHMALVGSQSATVCLCAECMVHCMNVRPHRLRGCC